MFKRKDKSTYKYNKKECQWVQTTSFKLCVVTSVRTISVKNLSRWNQACCWDFVLKKILKLKKKIHVGLHSDIYELISLKCGVIIVNISPCMLIAVSLIFTFIPGPQGYEKLNTSELIFYQFSIHLDEICFPSVTCWSDEPNTRFI